MTARPALSRRTFLAVGAVAGVGIVIGMRLATRAVHAPKGESELGFQPNAYLKIAPDGKITFNIGQAEFGQQIYTCLAQIIADELDADWSQVSVDAAIPGPAFYDAYFGSQVVGESRSTEHFYEPMRRAGATGRTLLVQAASRLWKVSESACRTNRSFVLGPDNRKIAYGDLVEVAAKLPHVDPGKIELKSPKDFTLIGAPVARIEGPDKVTGAPIYGLDIHLPGMLTAMVTRCPVLGGKAVSVQSDEAAKVPGVKMIVQIPSGVAVLANGYWAAHTARDKLKITWDNGPRAAMSSEDFQRQYSALARTRGSTIIERGDVDRELQGNANAITLDYSMPYHAHTPMEPLNCTMQLKDNHCNVWVGSQYQTHDINVVSTILGVPTDSIRYETAYLGGSFGRRCPPDSDFVAETAEIIKAVRPLDVPIRNVWAREDDIRGGFYRPMVVNRISGAIGPTGLPIAWSHTVVSQSILEGSEWAAWIKDGNDPEATWGAADMVYDVPNFRVDLHTPKFGPTVTWMRGAGDFNTAFVVETFLDELAHRAKKDPLEYRRRLIKNDPRRVEVLNLAAEKGSWGAPVAAGSGRGIACHWYRGTWVAAVAEVSIVDGKLVIDRIVCAVDCGRVINPDGARAQAEGAIIFGLNCTLYSKITFRDGKVEQSNFDGYPLLRIDAAPRIEVYFADRVDQPPTGMGEVTSTSVAPAVCNAVFAATGRRIRTLPLADVIKV